MSADRVYQIRLTLAEIGAARFGRIRSSYSHNPPRISLPIPPNPEGDLILLVAGIDLVEGIFGFLDHIAGKDKRRTLFGFHNRGNSQAVTFIRQVVSNLGAGDAARS